MWRYSFSCWFSFFNSKSTTVYLKPQRQHNRAEKSSLTHNTQWLELAVKRWFKYTFVNKKNSSRRYWLPTVCESHSHSSWTLFVCVSCDLLAFFFMFVWINPAGKWKTTFTELLQTLSSQHAHYTTQWVIEQMLPTWPYLTSLKRIPGWR